MSKYKLGSTTINTHNSDLFFHVNDSENYSLRVGLAEVTQLVKALGVVSAVFTIPKPPDELTFSPFLFTYEKESKGFSLTRNDETMSGVLTLQEKHIDELQTLLTSIANDVLDRNKHKGPNRRRF